MFFRPILPPYDPLEWAKKPFAEKSRMVCHAWAMQGYGTPIAVYLVYVVKIAAYVGGWALFCRRDVPAWWFRPESFQKAILWSMLFEILGLGCGSGPLTGRYVPPVGGFLYFLRPGTTKLPVIGRGFRRTWLDVGLYAATLGVTIHALASPAPLHEHAIALATLLPVLGLRDKTLFLAARAEHYWTTIAVFALAPVAFIPGAKAIHAALWFWAGVSKLNHHFPSVVGVMTSNSPFTRFEFIRKLMYRRYPEDVGPSRTQCGFEEGELRCIMVEAQPLGGDSLHWRIHDAKTGLREEGQALVKDLRERQPWGAQGNSIASL